VYRVSSSRKIFIQGIRIRISTLFGCV